jgi:hypothetical protein
MSEQKRPAVPLNKHGQPVWVELPSGQRKYVDYRPLPIKILSILGFVLLFPFIVIFTIWVERYELKALIAESVQNFKMRNWTEEARTAYHEAYQRKWESEQDPAYKKFMGWE